jgi:hypothetical protein
MQPPRTPADWLALAAEARDHEMRIPDAGARQIMLRIAAGYEKLAQHAALAADRKVRTDSQD